MILKRIRAHYFKTYQTLDLDLTTLPDRPIILIGGANGGGKTTLFEAIYGGLYGLKIRNAREFDQLVSAGYAPLDAPVRARVQVQLELHFAGNVLQHEQQYVLKRTYALNPQGQPQEAVELNLNGDIFRYGSAMPSKERQRAEAEVAKIIKANLPQELSRYFLFDAMEAGALLKTDQLNRLIRENIENVMGFQKYQQLAQAAEKLVQQHTADRLALDKEKEEYQRLTSTKATLEQRAAQLERQLGTARQYAVDQQPTYQALKNSVNAEETLTQKIKTLEQQMEATQGRHRAWREQLTGFVENLERHIVLPQLAAGFRAEIGLVEQSRAQQQTQQRAPLTPDTLTALVEQALAYLTARRALVPGVPVPVPDLVAHLLQPAAPDPAAAAPAPYAHLDEAEVRALAQLLATAYSNPFSGLASQQPELAEALTAVGRQQQQIADYRRQIAGHDYSLLQEFEHNEKEIKRLENDLRDAREESKKLDAKIHQMDIQVEAEPDPRQEALLRLRPFFQGVADALLRTKKARIESQMLADLNLNLVAYRGVIERVELSDELRDLTFRLYHRAGNEIYLEHLNTASKQIVVQCLLKALHESGDYDPPVMIDTVMGVLGEESRAAMLENYFPTLSHQTILLSSDSEIRPREEFVALEAKVARAYTLQRDKENQCTDVVGGYFGRAVLE